MSGNNLIPVGVGFVESKDRLKSVREAETYSFPQVPRIGEVINIGDGNDPWLVESVIYWTEPLQNFRDNPKVSLLLIQK